MIIEVLSALLLGGGSLVLVLAAFLIVRMPTFYTRLHAASVNETLGAALLLLGLAFHTGKYANGFEVLLKLILILVFLFMTSPVASHALAKAAISGNVLPGQLRRLREENGDSANAEAGGSAADGEEGETA